MGYIVFFILIALLIKKGLINGKGFSDLAKIFGGIAVLILVLSLLMSPVFWGILAFVVLGVIIAIISLTMKYSGEKREEMYGWNSEEYQAKYAEAVKMFKQMYREQRGPEFAKMNVTEQKVQELKEEKMAREAAGKYVDEEFTKKYGTDKAANMAQNAAKRGTAGAPQGTPNGWIAPNQAQYANQNGWVPPSQAGRAAQGQTGPGIPYHYANQPNTRQGAGQGVAYAAQGSAAQAQALRSQQKALKSSILPKSAVRRHKIVRKFNEQYNLFLTEEQIKRIVDASYMSVAWKTEVEAMSLKYDSVYQWLTGDTAYLRAYLKVFGVQDVTSDFKQQMQIVMDSFEEIFDYSDTISGLSLERRIEMINSKFLTNFDDITYMIAYRYLESLGLHHDLGETQLNKIDGSLDDLMAKYDNMSTEGVNEALSQVAPPQGTGSGAT